MNAHDGFDRTVADWLDEQAGHGMPAYLDEILVTTTRARQRPWWSSLERWLPMQTTLRFAPAPRIAWLLVVIGLVVAVGAAVLLIGSQRRQPAPPFGLARNGAIVYGGTDNDIHTYDPVTGATTTLIAGAAGDHLPLLSPDGTGLFFVGDSEPRVQGVGPFEPMIMVANADGSDVRALTGALAGLSAGNGNIVWSHDGSKVAVSSGPDAAPRLEILSLDGSTKPVVLDTGGMRAGYIAFRPNDGEVTFRGMTPHGDGLYAVGADGHGLRTIVPTTSGDGGIVSPDGTKLAYQTWDGTTGVIHVVDVDTGVDSVPALDPPADARMADDYAQWSPDGTRLLFIRYHVGTDNHLAVAPVGGAHAVEIGPAMPNCSCGYLAAFSPDGSGVLVHYDADGSTWLLDPTGATPGKQRLVDDRPAASWQRLAP